MQQLLVDLQEISGFVAAQRRAGSSVETVVLRQFEAIKLRVKRLAESIGPIDMAEATKLTDVILNGPWSAEQRAVLADQVSAWATSVLGKATGSRKLQTCEYFEHYLDAREYDSVNSRSKSFVLCRASRVDILTRKAATIGIFCPSEPTSGKITAIIFWGEGKQFTDTDCKETLFQIKTGVKALQVMSPYPLQYLARYPANPSDLPDNMKLYAFPDGVPGVMSFTGLVTFTKMVKLRVPKGSQAAHDMESRILKEIRNHFVSMRPEQPAGSSRSPPGVSHHVFPLKFSGEKVPGVGREESGVHPPEAGTPAVGGTPTVGGTTTVGSTATVESTKATLSKLDELETVMLGARGVYDGTTGTPTPKTKAKAKATADSKAPAPKAMKVKPPAAAMKVKPVAMKASKAPLSLANLLKEYTRADKTRGAFTTKAHFDALKASLRRGDDAATANAHAKHVRGRAAVFWDRSH